jgi:hypothetical protein
MLNRILLVAVVIGAGVAWDSQIAAGQEPIVALPEREDFHLFLLVGQSNMAGRGKVPAVSSAPHPRVLMFDKSLQWVPARDPLHFDKPAIVGVGLGTSFANYLAEQDPTITIGLIPCAVGGSPIAAWEPAGYHPSTKTHPWDDAIPRAKAALLSGTLKGILWHQGESDSKKGLSQLYEGKLDALVARFRNELAAPNVPFIAGQMGQFTERPWDEHRRRVDGAQRTLAERVPVAAFVDSDGLQHKGDEVHFDTESYHELGRRYADAYGQLTAKQTATSELWYRLERTVAHQGFDGKMCWVHARAGIVPSPSESSEPPAVVMTMQPLLLSGSDVFYALHQTSTAGAQAWTKPAELKNFARQPFGENRERTVCDFTPKWHAPSGKLLGIGQTVVYENNRVMHVRPRATAYAVYDAERSSWSAWKTVDLPLEPRFQNAGSGSVQRFDLPNGEILLPIYFKEPAAAEYATTVLRCRFDGTTLTYVEHGNEMSVPIKRGLYEPSVTQFAGRFFLTMRNDDHGYVSASDDGIQYTTPKRWTFDDGQDLGNYNTQQHWVTHRKGLFLVYTRRGADNDHVFRHRAPLFIARVDPDKMHVIRATEQVLVPEKGARLGNFGVVDVSEDETWVTVTEWMQPLGVEKHGSDNRVYVVKLHWNRLNQLQD